MSCIRVWQTFEVFTYWALRLGAPINIDCGCTAFGYHVWSAGTTGTAVIMKDLSLSLAGAMTSFYSAMYI